MIQLILNVYAIFMTICTFI